MSNKRLSILKEIQQKNIEEIEEISQEIEFVNQEGNSLADLASNKYVNLDIYPLWQKILTRALTCGAITLEPLFSYFLYFACTNIIDETFSEFGIKNKNLQLIVNVSMIALVAISFINNVTAVNPIEEAENLLEILHSSKPQESNCEQSSANILAKFNQIASFPYFIVTAAADAITIGYMSPRLGVQLGLGVPATLLSTTYLYMLYGHNLRKHAEETISEIKKCFPSLKRLWQAPARLLEANLQVCSSIIYLSVIDGYIMNELLRTIFKHDKIDKINFCLIVVVSGISIYVSLQSRTLQVYSRFFKAEYMDIPTEIITKAKPSKIGIFSDFIISFTRGGPLGIMFYRHSPFSHKFAKLAVSISTSTVVTLQNLYTLYQTRKLDSALSKHMQKKKERDSLRLQENPYQKLTSSELFDAIAENYQVNYLSNISGFINLGARVARWIAFVGYMISIQKVFEQYGIPTRLDYKDIICLASIWGIPNFAAEYKFFQAEFRENWSYYRAKFAIGAPDENIAKRPMPARALVSFFSSKKYYESKKMINLLEEIDNNKREKDALIIRSFV